MKLHKMYVIIEISTNKVVHQTSNKFESMKMLGVLQKAGAKVTAQCYYQ